MAKNKNKEKEPRTPGVTPESYEGQMDAIMDYEYDKDLNIHQRMWRAMKEVWYVQKASANGEYYNTLEHDDVTRKVRPALLKYGIHAYPMNLEIGEHKTIVKQKTDRNGNSYEVIDNFTQATIWVQFTNIDNPEDNIKVPAYGHGIDTGANAPGKAISYAIKYCFVKGMMLETGDEEDRHLEEDPTDSNILFLYNQIGKELFGDDWETKSKKKIFSVTNGKTSVASRAPARLVNEALKNLYELKRKQSEEPEKDIEEIDSEVDSDSQDNEILSDFQ